MNEAAHTISLISPSKSWKSSSSLIRATVIQHPSFYSGVNEPGKLVLRVEWNETFQTCRDPFDTKKFSNVRPEILVGWIAPLESRLRVNFKLAEKLRPSIKKVSEKCQKSLSGGNGSALRAVIKFFFFEKVFPVMCMGTCGVCCLVSLIVMPDRWH